jgi:hypothetical protein
MAATDAQTIVFQPLLRALAENWWLLLLRVWLQLRLGFWHLPGRE